MPVAVGISVLAAGGDVGGAGDHASGSLVSIAPPDAGVSVKKIPETGKAVPVTDHHAAGGRAAPIPPHVFGDAGKRIGKRIGAEQRPTGTLAQRDDGKIARITSRRNGSAAAQVPRLIGGDPLEHLSIGPSHAADGQKDEDDAAAYLLCHFRTLALYRLPQEPQ